MDPIANIREQRELARKVLNRPYVSSGAVRAEHIRLAELVLALDEWRRRGGFDPYEQKGA